MEGRTYESEYTEEHLTEKGFNQKTVEEVLALADVEINGSSPWGITVNDDRAYNVFLKGSSLDIGEAYMDGWWDSEAIDQLMDRVLRADLRDKLLKNPMLLAKSAAARISGLVGSQSKTNAESNVKHHYDIGTDLFTAMLDKRLAYSCGYWKGANSLNEAQEAKLELSYQKLKLEPGMKVLDIGCGWGSFAKYAAEHGINVVGITLSDDQVEFAKKDTKGLSVEIRKQDYRDVNEGEKFDRIISIGMFEHVGPNNYKTFMKSVDRNLKDGGLFLLHTIGNNSNHATTDPWIEKYIFPGGVLPSKNLITEAVKGYFTEKDWHSFGTDYDKTLMAWDENFNKNYENLNQGKYDQKFKRMWNLYLKGCAGCFRAESNQLWQFVLSKGNFDGYESVR